MKNRVQSQINRIANEARGRYQAWLDGARSQTEQVAGRVRDGKKPVRTLSRLGVKLTDVSHRTTAKVLKQQTTMVEHQIDALAGRLRNVAHADSIVGLVRDQVRMIPDNASQFMSDTRATFSIVAGAGGEVRKIIGTTVSELRGASPAAASKGRKKKAKAKTKIKTKTKAKRVKVKPAASSPAKARPAKARTAKVVTTPKAESKAA